MCGCHAGVSELGGRAAVLSTHTFVPPADDTGPFPVVSFEHAQRNGRKNISAYTLLVVTCFRGLSFSLIAAVMHSGQDSGSGHYTYLIDQKGWLYCDDSNTALVTDTV